MRDLIRKHLIFTGTVQGVGFRWRARRAAEFAGVSGWVRNDRDGGVSMELQGSEAQLDAVLAAIERGLYIRIEQAESRTIPLVSGERGFHTLDDER